MLVAFSAGFLLFCERGLRHGEGRIFPVINDMILTGGWPQGENPVHPYPVTGDWFDIDTISDILKANRYLLENLTDEAISGLYVPPNDTLDFGNGISLESGISIEPGVQLIGPCLIENNITIERNCSIGPNVSMDENTYVGANANIRNAVVFGSSSIPDDCRLDRVVVFRSNIIREVET